MTAGHDAQLLSRWLPALTLVRWPFASAPHDKACPVAHTSQTRWGVPAMKSQRMLWRTPSASSRQKTSQVHESSSVQLQLGRFWEAKRQGEEVCRIALRWRRRPLFHWRYHRHVTRGARLPGRQWEGAVACWLSSSTAEQREMLWSMRDRRRCRRSRKERGQ